MKTISKGVLSVVIAVLLGLMIFPGVTVHAEEISGKGYTVQTAIDIEFGKTYTKSWNKETTRLPCYNKIVISKNGLIEINATKPIDDDPEHGALRFFLYNNNNEFIWGCGTGDSLNDASTSYTKKVGLAAGIYYLTIEPGFMIESGSASTSYTINFTAGNYEIESNESVSEATEVRLNALYTGYYGNEYADAEEEDYWKVFLTAGKQYRLCIGNYRNIEPTTAYFMFMDPNGDDVVSLGERHVTVTAKLESKLNENGENYDDFIAKYTGYYYLRLTNYHSRQIEYSIRFTSDDPADQYVDEANRNLVWENVAGKSYWYENNVRQGTATDSKCFSYDGTLRGREIYDPASDGWYWLDVNADGAKAVGKEVFMPYVYQDEKGWNASEIKNNANASSALADGNYEHAELAAQVQKAIENGTGKWVRYDSNGKMLKGWVKIQGSLAELYPSQAGNTYYYDRKTGLMAKGWTVIDGTSYYFDEITGVLK